MQPRVCRTREGGLEGFLWWLGTMIGEALGKWGNIGELLVEYWNRSRHGITNKVALVIKVIGGLSRHQRL